MKEKEKIDDKSIVVQNSQFYSETLRSIKAYLKLQSIDTPATSLQKFVALNCNRHNRGDSIIPNSIAMQESNSTADEDSLCKYLSRIKPSLCDKIHFLEEIRIILLSAIPVVGKKEREILKKYHIDIHLLELSISRYYNRENEQYAKFKEFMDVNFALEKDDIIGLACRGDYGAVIKAFPDLEAPIEEFYKLKSDNINEIEAWKAKYMISDDLCKIMSGRYKDFKNRYEEHCYNLFHNKYTDFSDPNIEILSKNYQNFANKDSWVRLIYNLTICDCSLRDFESCFENLFFNIPKSNIFDSLDYLAFSRKCAFYFPYVVDSIDLNCLVVEMLISFATKNKLNHDYIVEKYANLLQDTQEYEQMCRFVVNYPLKDFRYSISFISFFIDNFSKYRSLIVNQLEEDDTIKFVHYMSELSMLNDKEMIMFVFKSEYFIYFADKIAIALSVRDDLPSKFIVTLISHISDIEEDKNISLSKLKSILAQKLI